MQRQAASPALAELRAALSSSAGGEPAWFGHRGKSGSSGGRVTPWYRPAGPRGHTSRSCTPSAASSLPPSVTATRAGTAVGESRCAPPSTTPAEVDGSAPARRRTPTCPNPPQREQRLRGDEGRRADC